MGATLLEKILIGPLLLCAIARTLLSIFGLPFRGEDGAETALEHVLYTAFRCVFTWFSIGQLQFILPSWLSAYETECKKRGVEADVVDIPNTKAKGFWLGNKKAATYTMVWYHCGGFVMPGPPPLIDVMKKIIQWSNGNLAVFCVSYTLAPQERYPRQIGEAVEALRYVLNLQGHSPERTLIGGDSAGGNLVLAVLSHISGHPHPQSSIVRPLEISGNLYGAIALAPWVSSEVERFPSTRRYTGRDLINPSTGTYWITAYKGSENVKDDEYIVPELASPEWWSGAKVSAFLALVGQHEILRDSILSWAQHFQEGATGVDFKLVIGRTEIHDAPLTPKPEKVLIGNEEVYQEAAIRHWIKSRLT